MEVVNLIKDYWVLITALVSFLSTLSLFVFYLIQATKCSLRNDILDIYDKCKETKTITHYQLDAIHHSAEIYFKLKGNSFVKDVVGRVDEFELID